MAMTIFGDSTSKNVFFKNESHKLSQAFPVKEGDTILKGNLTVLNTDGTVSPFKAGGNLKLIIGVASTDSKNPAYVESRQHGPLEVTVFTKAFCIVYGTAKADSTTAGPVKPTGVIDSTTGYSEFEEDATSTSPIAYNITGAADAGDLIQILLL